MAPTKRRQIPHTPHVISPSPVSTPSESARDGYFGPVTRSSTRAASARSPAPVDEDSGGSDPEKRARARTVLDGGVGRPRRLSGLTGKRQTINHLSPAAANKNYWREMSRSPSPLGLIPIHQRWRSFIHRHEIPRKILHVSIGFLALALYTNGVQTWAIHPVLLTLLLPIALTDVLRHRYWQINRFYIRCLGALMRESEVDGYNGVISYLLGAWIVMRFCPKDVSVMSVLLLSWCDTAASTFGRLWGHLTPKVRNGKSLAGSIAACITGIATAAVWWGILGPMFNNYNSAENAFAFQGVLTLPSSARDVLGLSVAQASVGGYTALGLVSLWAGLVASASEALDIFGWDDNLTIPVLCGVGLWGFLGLFG
ncbi:hypothetical protein P153DRAFT_395671 [Dothidotthia symphoricarpi CBS 119687]|uniref:Phosphatidate cytidylyltransferase n=1 Tax=Dothidotthia symphoricarpi CBS 119687 TaxID=1392245 RepID=A0A6A6AGI6_9PLEO|nr:uncharacterized protein P153DRAFT_395671 [Dothidotthia symphoricarpi CBS 119687]KAF2130235.1 hypothetical protein P153DRAFT_395671 [Dothidotthia symphoricarpi CBS 119687]